MVKSPKTLEEVNYLVIMSTGPPGLPVSEE